MMQKQQKRTKATKKPVKNKSFPAKAKKAYVAQGARFRNPEPLMISTKDSCRITHREFLQDVSSTINFTTTSYAVNPGIGTCFPWLNQIAKRYETYRFEKLHFLYAPRCSTSTAGSVILAIDYDPQDPAPTFKSDVLAYHGCVASSPWDECCNQADAPTLKRRSPLFIRGTNVAGTDIKTYDLGNLYLCTSGFAGDGTPCGELYVEYTVVLNTPQISSDAISGAKITATAGLDSTHLFGSAAITGGLACAVTATNTLTFNESYEGLLVAYLTGTGILTTAPTVTGTATNTVIGSSAFTVSGYGVLVLKVKAAKGQTIIPTCTATTITAVTWYIGNFDYDL